MPPLSEEQTGVRGKYLYHRGTKEMKGKKGFTLTLAILMLVAFIIPGTVIAETAETFWDFEADVVVVGAGGAGFRPH